MLIFDHIFHDFELYYEQEIRYHIHCKTEYLHTWLL